MYKKWGEFFKINLSQVQIYAYNRKSEWRAVSIYMSGNEMIDMTQFVVKNIPNLGSVDLSENVLSHFSEQSSIVNVTGIENLNLKRNHLTHLPRGILRFSHSRYLMKGNA